MNYQKRLIKDLIPYNRNPRDNSKAIDKVALSIKEFGYKVPIVINSENIIINGHTRLLALKKLGYEEVDVIVADDLSDEQVKAFRLADNKTAEYSEWDFNLLNKELEDILNTTDLDMTMFGFDDVVKSIEDSIEHDKDMLDSVNDREEQPSEEQPSEETPKEKEGYYGDERENTYNAYNLHDYDELRTEGFYQMPRLLESQYIPDRLIGFNYVLSTKEKDDKSCIHFYLDDYQFERLWNRPQYYIDKIKEKYNACLTPDFSLYLDMPMAMKIWNVYRSRLIGQLMQDNGLEVIPTLSWAEEDTYSFCFDGIETGSVVSVSTIGVKRNEESYNIGVKGMNKAIEVLKPSCVIVYGGKLEDYDFGKTKAVYIENEVMERWKGGD